MFEGVHPGFLVTVLLVFGLQAVWGFVTGQYLRREGFTHLKAVSEEENPVEFVCVTTVYATVALIALGVLILKIWSAQ